MANTYTLIQAQTLASSAATVTFSSIPATYTDLVLRWSTRDNNAASSNTIKINFNADTTLIYSFTNIQGYNATAYSNRSSNNDYLNAYYSDSASATANTYSNGEFYLPNYLSTTSKAMSVAAVYEDNATATGAIGAQAGLYRNTTAISSIALVPAAAASLLATSSFYLYGIKNS